MSLKSSIFIKRVPYLKFYLIQKKMENLTGERKGRSIIKGDLQKQLENLNPQLQARKTMTCGSLISITRAPFVSKRTGKAWNPKRQMRKTGPWLSCGCALTPTRRPADFLTPPLSLHGLDANPPPTTGSLLSPLPAPRLLGPSPYPPSGLSSQAALLCKVFSDHPI